jgi:hypothetical protein
LSDGRGELIVGLGLVGLTVGAEVAGVDVAGVVLGVVVVTDELEAAGGGLTQK